MPELEVHVISQSSVHLTRSGNQSEQELDVPTEFYGSTIPRKDSHAPCVFGVMLLDLLPVDV